jgi:hypothetical protein
MNTNDTASILSRLQRVLGGGAPIPPPPTTSSSSSSSTSGRRSQKPSSSSSSSSNLKPLEKNFVLSSDARDMLIRKGSKTTMTARDVIGVDGRIVLSSESAIEKSVVSDSNAVSVIVSNSNRLEEELTRLAGLLSDFEPSQLLSNGAAFDAWRAETLRLLLVCSGHSTKLAQTLSDTKDTLLRERVSFLEKIDASSRSNTVTRTALDSLEEQNRVLQTKALSLERECKALREQVKKAETINKTEIKKTAEATKAAIDARTDLAFALAKSAESNFRVAKAVVDHHQQQQQQQQRFQTDGGSSSSYGMSNTYTNTETSPSSANLNAAIGALVVASSGIRYGGNISVDTVREDISSPIPSSSSSLQHLPSYSSYSFNAPSSSSSSSSSSSFSPSMSLLVQQESQSQSRVHLLPSSPTPARQTSSSRSRSPTPHYLQPTISHMIRKSTTNSASGEFYSPSKNGLSMFGTHQEPVIRPPSPFHSRSNSPTNAASSPSSSRKGSRANSPSNSIQRDRSPKTTISLNMGLGNQGISNTNDISPKTNLEESSASSRMMFGASGVIDAYDNPLMFEKSSFLQESNSHQESHNQFSNTLSNSINSANAIDTTIGEGKIKKLSSPTLEELSATSLSETLSSVTPTATTTSINTKGIETIAPVITQNFAIQPVVSAIDSSSQTKGQDPLSSSISSTPQPLQTQTQTPATTTVVPTVPTVPTPSPVVSYEDLSKEDLRKICETRGLSIEGKLKELRQRLRDDDATKNSTIISTNSETQDQTGTVLSNQQQQRATVLIATDFEAMSKEDLRAACVAKGFENAETMKMKEMRAKLREAEDADIAAANVQQSLSKPVVPSYESLGKDALREECEKRGLSKEGKIKELRVRLVEDDEVKAAALAATVSIPSTEAILSTTISTTNNSADSASSTSSVETFLPPLPASVTAPLLSSPLQTSSPRAGSGTSTSWTRHITVKKLPSSPQSQSLEGSKSLVSAVFAPSPAQTLDTLTVSSASSKPNTMSMSTGGGGLGLSSKATHPTLKKLLESTPSVSASGLSSPLASLDYKTSSVQDLLKAAMQFGSAPPPPPPLPSSLTSAENLLKIKQGDAELITNAALLRTASSLGSLAPVVNNEEREPRV